MIRKCKNQNGLCFVAFCACVAYCIMLDGVSKCYLRIVHILFAIMCLFHFDKESFLSSP